MRYHMWKPWKGVQRCVRPGCEVLRQFVKSRAQYRDAPEGWKKRRPICNGGSTADTSK